MSEFNKITTEPAKVLPDELEKKIELVNKSLSDARANTERLEGVRSQKEKDVAALEAKLADLGEKESQFKERSNSLTAQSINLENQVLGKKKELAEVTEALRLAKASLEELNAQIDLAKQGLEKQREEVAGRERSAKIFEQSLIERERKLDAYTEKVRRMIDAMKVTNL